MPSITRRLFLHRTAAAGAVAATFAVPVVVEASQPMSPADLVVWHMREIDRLVKEAGASTSCVILTTRNAAGRHRTTILGHNGTYEPDLEDGALVAPCHTTASPMENPT